MASKGKSKVESEIERFRANQHWDKAIEITKTQWSKTANGLGNDQYFLQFASVTINLLK